jgi:SAM-dependent methyltransferase
VSPCPLCGSRDLVAYHDRADAACGACGALERHRALAGQLRDQLERRAGGRCLEVGPLNPFVFGGFLRARGWSYEAVDKRALRERSDPGGFDTFIDHDADLTDLRFADTGAYELVVLQHVLEEIGDYGAALDELSRVVEPGGRAVFEMPWVPGSPTRHKPADRYGNRWQFGDDLLDELRSRFAGVATHELREGVYVGRFFVCDGR